MNVLGMLAAIFIAVTGLTKRDLPKEGYLSGVLHIAMQGLCTGASQDIRHNAIGYLALYQKEVCPITKTSAEQRNFQFYCRDVLFSFIILIRERLHGWTPGAIILHTLTTILWTNGASVQLNTIINERKQEIDKNLKILSNKHSAFKTAAEQLCNLSPCFMTIRRLANGITCDNIPSIRLTQLVKNNFYKLKKSGVPDLAPKREVALLDFIAFYPLIATCAYPTKSVARDFLLNGMIDIDSLSCPNISQILQTCKGQEKMARHQNPIKSDSRHSARRAAKGV